MLPFRQSSAANAHIQEARGFLVIVSCNRVGGGQPGLHGGIGPTDLFRPLGVNTLGCGQSMARVDFTQNLRLRISAHYTLPVAGSEANEGVQKRIAAQVIADSLEVTPTGQPHQCLGERPQAASR